MDKSVFSNEQLTDFARWLKVICEPNRLLLLEKIIEGVQCNCDLREAGLIETERDPVDARWVYYSVNLKAMEEIGQIFSGFFDTTRIQPRRLTCGPQMTDEQRLSLLRMTK
jgi:ArsR family transcriptional regulator